jgi:hypothetical protein
MVPVVVMVAVVRRVDVTKVEEGREEEDEEALFTQPPEPEST